MTLLCDSYYQGIGLKPMHNHGNDVPPTPNGIIPCSTRLSIAPQYFAGASPLDLALVHGGSHSEVFH